MVRHMLEASHWYLNGRDVVGRKTEFENQVNSILKALP